jgi:hypothetical protein
LPIGAADQRFHIITKFFAVRHREQLHAPSRSIFMEKRELIMPVFLLWAVPAVIIVGGVGYFLVHVH